MVKKEQNKLNKEMINFARKWNLFLVPSPNHMTKSCWNVPVMRMRFKFKLWTSVEMFPKLRNDL